jgi:hypothetical protein
MSARRRLQSLSLLLAPVLTPLAVQGAAAGTPVVFSPAAGVRTTLSVHDRTVDVVVAGPRERTPTTIVLDTDRPLHIQIHDVDGDGRQDFSVFHGDDGKGSFEIRHVYLYSVREGRFLPLLPACGDEFVNPRFDTGARTLVNAYVEDNVWKTCRMQFGRRPEQVTPKKHR